MATSKKRKAAVAAAAAVARAAKKRKQEAAPVIDHEPEVPCLDAFFSNFNKEPNFHEPPADFDQNVVNNADVDQRICYYFEYLATEKGNQFFAQRIHSNAMILHRMLKAIRNRIDIDKRQIEEMEVLLVNDKKGKARHVGAMKKNIKLVKATLDRDKYWETIIELELEMSKSTERLPERIELISGPGRLSLMRVLVANQAQHTLTRVSLHQTGFGDDDQASLDSLFVQFRSVRDQVIDVLQLVLDLAERRSYSQEGVSGVIQRHRNEIWDLWGSIACE